jgi:hypothetical protein
MARQRTLIDQRVDLHLHTTASDGTWTPEQLVAEVQRAGIGLFAVTDHDSLGALAHTAGLVPGTGLGFLPGVELSSQFNGRVIHLLVYGFDPMDPALNAFVRGNEARLTGASDEGVRRLAAAGYPVSLDEYATYTWDRSRGGWKALNYLIDRGLCRDVPSYFGELYGGHVAHPDGHFPGPQEVIAVARAAGAVVVLAHPGVAPALEGRQIDALVEMGVQGLECFAFVHSEMDTGRFVEYCRRRHLLITGGSDCHGTFEGRALGVPPVFLSELHLGTLKERILT